MENFDKNSPVAEDIAVAVSDQRRSALPGRPVAFRPFIQEAPEKLSS